MSKRETIDGLSNAIYDLEAKLRAARKERHALEVELVGDFTDYCVRAGLDGAVPEVSLVTLVCGGDDTYRESLPKLLGCGGPSKEVIIVANKPDAEMLEYFKTIEHAALIVQCCRNLGVIAKNLGYHLARGKLIFSSDSDVVVEPEATEKVVKYMDAHPGAWLVGPCGGRLEPTKWTEKDWPVRQDWAGTSFGYNDNDLEHFEDQNPLAVDGIRLDVIPSMFWCFRRSVLDKIGYLDWKFGPFVGSDADFCLRIKEAGGMVHLVRSKIKHIGGGGQSQKLLNKEMLKEISGKHKAWLHGRWYPKREKVLHHFTGK